MTNRPPGASASSNIPHCISYNTDLAAHQHKSLESRKPFHEQIPYDTGPEWTTKGQSDDGLSEMFEERYVLHSIDCAEYTDSLLRHYSYECKATAQERPYVSRPSRTQQLVNPKLAPRLTNDAPNELLRRKGVADEELTKAEKEREQAQRKQSPSGEIPKSKAKRARSESASSSESVSTVSTNKSRSPSPAKKRRGRGHNCDHTSEQTYPANSPSRSRSRGRKRKHNSSPEYSSSESSSRHRSKNRKSRRHRTISPDDRGRHSYDRRGSHRSRSRSGSVDKSRVAKERRSLDGDERPERKYAEERFERRGTELSDLRNGRVSQQPLNQTSNAERDHPRRKDRSLSPYSKRLALTQAMNIPR